MIDQWIRGFPWFSAKCPRGFFVISFFAGPRSAKSSPTVGYWAKGCIFVWGGALHWLRCLVRTKLQWRIKPDLHYIETLGGVCIQNVASSGRKSWGRDSLTMQVTFFAPCIVMRVRGILEFAGHAQHNLRSMDWHAHWRARNCWVFSSPWGCNGRIACGPTEGPKMPKKNRILGQIYLYLSLALVISDFRQTSFSPQSLQQCLSPHPLLEPGSPSIFPPGWPKKTGPRGNRYPPSLLCRTVHCPEKPYLFDA